MVVKCRVQGAGCRVQGFGVWGPDLDPSITKTMFFATEPIPIAAWYHGRDRAL